MAASRTASDFTRILARAPRQAEKRASSTLSEPQDWLLQVFGTQSKSGAIVNEGTALTVAAFSACVNILAQSMASFPVRVMQRSGKGDEEVREHPLNYILAREPNGLQTSFRYRSFLQTCLGMGGNAYSRIRRNSYFEPMALEPISPLKIHPRVLPESGTMVYRVGGDDLMQSDVLHLRGLSTDGFIGVSPIRALRETIGLSLTAQEFSSRSFNNGNRQPGVFVGNEAMNTEKAKEFQAEWQKLYAGTANAGKTPFVWGGVDWKAAGFSSQDAELLLTRKFEVEEIARYFRIPLFLLQSTDKATTWGSGIEQMSRGFVDFTLKPWAKNWEEEIAFSLLTAKEKKNGLFICFDYTDLLRGSPTEQAAYFTTLWNGGLIRRNEARTGLGFVNLPDALGDIFSAAPNSGAAAVSLTPSSTPKSQ